MKILKTFNKITGSVRRQKKKVKKDDYLAVASATATGSVNSNSVSKNAEEISVSEYGLVLDSPYGMDPPVVEESPKQASKSSTNKIFLVVLVIDGSTRRFEVVEREFEPSTSVVQDILDKIPMDVTDNSLLQQNYECVSTMKGFALDNDELIRYYFMPNPNKKNLVILIPEGGDCAHFVKMATPIVNDARVIELLQISPDEKEVGVMENVKPLPDMGDNLPNKKTSAVEIENEQEEKNDLGETEKVIVQSMTKEPGKVKEVVDKIENDVKKSEKKTEEITLEESTEQDKFDHSDKKISSVVESEKSLAQDVSKTKKIIKVSEKKRKETVTSEEKVNKKKKESIEKIKVAKESEKVNKKKKESIEKVKVTKDSEKMIEEVGSKQESEKMKIEIGGHLLLFFIVFTCLSIYSAGIIHDSISSPLAYSEILAPGKWKNRCGLRHLLTDQINQVKLAIKQFDFIPDQIKEFEFIPRQISDCQSETLYLDKRGVLSLSDDDKVIWKMASLSNCSLGCSAMVEDDGQIMIGNEVAFLIAGKYSPKSTASTFEMKVKKPKRRRKRNI